MARHAGFLVRNPHIERFSQLLQGTATPLSTFSTEE